MLSLSIHRQVRYCCAIINYKCTFIQFGLYQKKSNRLSSFAPPVWLHHRIAVPHSIFNIRSGHLVYVQQCTCTLCAGTKRLTGVLIRQTLYDIKQVLFLDSVPYWFMGIDYITTICNEILYVITISMLPVVLCIFNELYSWGFYVFIKN